MSKCYKNEDLCLNVFSKMLPHSLLTFNTRALIKRTGSCTTEAVVALPCFLFPPTRVTTLCPSHQQHLKQCTSVCALARKQEDWECLQLTTDSTTSSAVNWTARYRGYWRGLAGSISSNNRRRLLVQVGCFVSGKYFCPTFKARAFTELSAVRRHSTVTWPGLLRLCCGLQKEKSWNMRLIWKRASGQREGEKLCKPSKLVLAGEAL